jgi:acetylornithine deacetylase
MPSECDLVIDIRVNDCYSNPEVVKEHVDAEVTPRSMHLNASSIPEAHGLVQAGIALGRTTTPTLSDQSVLSCKSLKLGPGDTKVALCR